jgi:hypothetical protein
VRERIALQALALLVYGERVYNHMITHESDIAALGRLNDVGLVYDAGGGGRLHKRKRGVESGGGISCSALPGEKDEKGVEPCNR